MQFQFCPKCAWRLEEQTVHDEIIPTCASAACGFRFYQNAKPCGTAVIADAAGRILMTVRAREPDQGKLDLPGGFLRGDETPEEGLVREVREELSVKAKVGPYLASTVDTYRFQGVESHTLNLAYLVTIVQGEPRPGDDVAALEWIDPATVDRSRLAFRNNAYFLEQYLRQRAG